MNEIFSSVEFYGVLAVVLAMVAAVVAAIVKRRLDTDPVSTALREAADQLDFVFNTDREIAGNINNDEYWGERIVGIQQDLSVVAGRLELEYLESGDRKTKQFCEIHVDLNGWWDSGIEVVSSDAPTYGDQANYLEPMETGDEEFDRDFEVRVQLPESIQEVLLTDEVSSLLRRLDDACDRLRIAGGTLQLRYEEPFLESRDWTEAIGETTDIATGLNDAV